MADAKRTGRAGAGAKPPKAPKPARATATPTTRILLMEFEVEGEKLAEILPTEKAAALQTQLGLDPGAALTSPFKILVPVGSGQGGPKGVIETEGSAPGYFRAIAEDSFNNGFELVPPDPKAFALKPL